ncbi:hypothetical protein B6U98_04215 [Thermoplasmatales archaeon ex4572_165]|nr:MAG: hypothetical protein B6U98_04215 [Thermoplasmatales archaeon ex4572_165]RLF59825.1 MAG: hypothetical protein DRN27_01500 [Thermoplasmata archaeon]
MDKIIKKKVLDWIDEKILRGEKIFEIDSCILDIGLNPLKKNDCECVEEVFTLHQKLINDQYCACFEKNT